MEVEPAPQDYTEETALAQRVARIFGYDGLLIDVRPGGGWQTIRKEDSITLVVDPAMLHPQTLKDAAGEELPADTVVPEQYSVYGTAHELGHVDDFLHPDSDFEKERNMQSSEHFFWNVLDDGIINKRLRNIPLLKSLTDEIYKDILFPSDDYSQRPKHVQFMYGWLLRNVTPDRTVTFSADVSQELDNLEEVEVNNRSYNLYRTLAHTNTDYTKRREIAAAHIFPIYESFLEEDRQDPQQNQQSSSSDEADRSSDGESEDNNTQKPDSPDSQNGEDDGNSQSSNWDDIYEAYSEASHCGHQESQEDDNHKEPHDVIKEAAGNLLDIQQEQAEKAAAEQTQPETSQSATGAGSIASELMLSPDDALAYERVVKEYRSDIHEVAKVFQQLTVPSVEYTSPRYKRQSDTSGLKLSPRDLFQVVVAHHSNVDPAVWRPVETVSKREGHTFNGLDVHLLVDASVSMEGKKADSAAACSVMLMEGLGAARRMVERYNPRAPKPDVRLQVILFGSSLQVVAPLSHDTEPKDKGITFTTVRDADSGGTIISDALKLTIDSAKRDPDRTQLAYVITDGDFYDKANAINALGDAGKNYLLYQYILLSPDSSPITKQSSHINNPGELPGNLNKQLRTVANKFLI